MATETRVALKQSPSPLTKHYATVICIHATAETASTDPPAAINRILACTVSLFFPTNFFFFYAARILLQLV